MAVNKTTITAITKKPLYAVKDFKVGQIFKSLANSPYMRIENEQVVDLANGWLFDARDFGDGYAPIASVTIETN